MRPRTTGAEDVNWDLSDLYPDPDEERIEGDIAELRSKVEAFRGRYRGAVASLDAAELARAVREGEEIGERLVRLGTYAYLRFSTDTASPERGAFLQRLREEEARTHTETLFFELEWIAVPDDRAAVLLAAAELAGYRHYLERARRYRPHRLSEPEERILSETEVVGASAWSRFFTELNAATRVRVGDEETGLEEALARLQRPDRDERRAAATGVTDALEATLRQRAFVFNTILLDKATSDRLRDFPHWLASRNLDNDASDEAVATLIESVVARFDIPQRYYRLKARLLGLDRLAHYDRLAPLAQTAEIMPWAEAQTLVCDAYEAFSPVTGGIVRDAFERRWIDAAPGESKAPGAFCSTTVPGVHPFVFMTYTGERRSILTLAHELGHAVHGELAGRRHGLFNADVPLTLAETASVFGEALTFRQLLAAETDPRRRLELLTGRLEDAIGTVFRQVAMNRFEDAIHTARRERGELSAQELGEHWVATQREVLGDAVEITDDDRVWWSYIPHFIGVPGYVYAYAFGYLFSLAIFRRYEREGTSLVDPYLELLSSGGSDTPERLAGLVGMDLTDPGFWSRGLESIDEILAEAETLAAEVRP